MSDVIEIIESNDMEIKRSRGRPKKEIINEIEAVIKKKGRPKKVNIAPVITPATIKKIIKMYNCNPPNINNPKTGRCLKPTSRLGRQVGNPLKILNPNTGRYVLRRGKIGKLLGGTVYE